MNCLLAKVRDSLPTQVAGRITWSAAGKSPAPPIGVAACHSRRPSANAETSRMCTYPTTIAGRTSCQVSLSRLVCIAMPVGTSLGSPQLLRLSIPSIWPTPRGTTRSQERISARCRVQQPARSLSQLADRSVILVATPTAGLTSSGLIFRSLRPSTLLRPSARFRFDAYNVFNHPVLGFNSAQGNLSVDNGAGGRITAIETDASPNAPNGLRQLQFGVRFDF